MKIVSIGGTGHVGYALWGIDKNPSLKLCAYSSVVPEDMTSEMAKTFEDKYNAKAFDDWRAMLDEIKPDMAIVSSRLDLNGVVSLECLKRGIHCFTEKTIALSFDLLDQIEQSAKDNNVQIIGMHGMRYEPEFYAGYEAYKSGAIGDAVILYGRKSYRFGETRPEYYKQRNLYGGTIPWVAVHAIDWFQWFAGSPCEIYAAHTTKDNFGYGDCESAAVVSTRYSNGVVGTISADFLRSKSAPTHGDDQLRIAGSRGVIEIKHGKAILTNDENSEVELDLAPAGDFFGDFCRSVRGEGTCRLTMEDTFAVSRIGLAARESADCHKLITM